MYRQYLYLAVNVRKFLLRLLGFNFSSSCPFEFPCFSCVALSPRMWLVTPALVWI